MGWGGVGRGPVTESEGRRDGKVVQGPFTDFKMGSEQRKAAGGKEPQSF